MNCLPKELARLIVPTGFELHPFEVAILRAASGMVARVTHISEAPDWWRFEEALTFPAEWAFPGSCGTFAIRGARDCMLRPLRPGAGEDEMLRIAGKPDPVREELRAIRRELAEESRP